MRRQISRARLRLMLDQPFLASAVARFPFMEATDAERCPTFATDGYRIIYNPAFAASCMHEKLVFILAHEVLHCLFGHLDRRETRDPELWNIAADLAVNSLLVDFGFALPEGALHAVWNRGLTVEEIYDRLQTPSSNSAFHGQALDVHLPPDGSQGLCNDPVSVPSPAERRRLRSQLLSEMRTHPGLPGNVRGMIEEDIRRASEPQVDWKALVADFVSGLRRDDYRLYPFNKKHVWRGIYLPSYGVPAPQHLVAAVDTSGSISIKDLARFLVELDRLRGVTLCRLTVLEFDTVIQKVTEIDPAEEGGAFGVSEDGRFTFRGRGGTDIRAPFDWIAEQMRRGETPPDALIVLTDGFGMMPERTPDYRILWIAPQHAARDFPFGQVVRMPPRR
jgi:predicted metal-dependent peptidase